MPAEWERHARTWMAFPAAPYVIGDDRDSASACWAEIANIISRYEPVTMIVETGGSGYARSLLDPGVHLLELPIDDSWLRDTGPTFLLDERGKLGAVNWKFNGWGAQAWASWERDSRVAEFIIGATGAQGFDSVLTNEGGGIHVDGAGTVLATETVQLDPGRNPTLTKEEVERELLGMLGTERVVWLSRGLQADYGGYGTRGHVDLVAAFVGPGLAVVHHQPDRSHPDFAVALDAHERLRSAGIGTVLIDAPDTSWQSDQPLDWSYINFYIGNGFVLQPTFDRPSSDDACSETLARLLPGRTVERVDSRLLFGFGGGIHCITQQEPHAVRSG